MPLEEIIEGISGPDADFLTMVYEIAKGIYDKLPPRKNGQPAFTHPSNVARILKLAQVQPYVIAAGLLHDVMEDLIDQERDRTGRPARMIEHNARGVFASEVIRTAEQTFFPREVAERLVEVAWTLTRHKADLYYKSISAVFNHTDHVVRMAAALVKLADRMHNIQTIENYGDEDKLYQCFKNLFILNNAKQLVLDAQQRDLDKRMLLSLGKLFKKSGKATFQALLRISHGAHSTPRGFQMYTYLALALHKFTMEYEGLWRITDGELEPGAHIFNLYHGIVKKYDQKLHHEDAAFNAAVARELEFLKATFGPLGLFEVELRQAISSKDALALAEVIASLLYREKYVIRGFECSRMCQRGMICMNRLPSA